MHKDLQKTREFIEKVIYDRSVVPEKQPIGYCVQCSGVKLDCFYYVPLKKLQRVYEE